MEMALGVANDTMTRTSQLDLDVLSGLVKVNFDRKINHKTGKRTGPISVSIFGQKIFGNRRRR